MSLDETTQDLGKWHEKWKTAEKEKNKLREKFFREASEELAESLPARNIEQVSAKDLEEALRIAQRRFHRYNVLDAQEAGDDLWNVVLEEDPEFKPFSYINKIDGKVYSRIVTEGTPFLDDDALRDEDPELWERITTEKVSRELRPLEDLDADDLAKMQPYLTAPKPTVRLSNPREAKQEELNEDDA